MPDPAWPLLLPAPGEDHLGPWRLRYLRRTARRLLEGPHDVAPWLLAAWRGLVPELAAVLSKRPGDLYAALLLPQVAAPLHAGALQVAIPQLLAELARRRALGREAWWPGPVAELLLPPLGRALTLAPARVGTVFRDGEIELSPGDVWDLQAPRGDEAFTRLAHGGWLATVDNNPLAMVEAHPDKEGNTLSLGAASVGTWRAALDDARALVAEHLPELAREHASLLATVVPVGGPTERSLSASYREAPGLVYLSLHPDRLTMAEALVHEVQHNKLNLVAHVDPLLYASEERFASPVRPDPRPLWGILLAVHAFLPIEQLYERAGATAHARERLDTIRRGNRDGLATLLAHARPTEAGRALLNGMARRAAG